MDTGIAKTKTKKILNSVETCVDESIAGFLALNPGLSSVKGFPRIVVRADLQQLKAAGKVLTLTGGGSGHEPAFYGYVGKGMMTAAVHGSIFASPGPGIILAALRALSLNNDAGVIVMFNNYTGDRLNFGIAIERARSEGIQVGVIINGDDCAVDSCNKVAGRRGLNGGLANMKMVGALAERGDAFDAIMAFANQMSKDISVCLTPCSVPGGGPLFTMGPDDMEIGMGLHGEAGVRRDKLRSSKEIVDMVLSHMTNAELQVHLSLKRGDQVAVLFNNLGATSDLEMNIVALNTLDWLEDIGVTVERAYSGRFVASQEMQGFSISLFRVNEERCSLLDDVTDATAWIKPYYSTNSNQRLRPDPVVIPGVMHTEDNTVTSTDLECAKLSPGDTLKAYEVVTKTCKALIEAEEKLNTLDSSCGDGDCGTTLKSGSAAILKMVEKKALASEEVYPYKFFLSLAGALEESMGGTSGALYSLFFTAAATLLKTSACGNDFIRALDKGLEVLAEYGGASRGDRTMLDPLYSALNVLKTEGRSVQEKTCDAVKAAEKTADDTAKMTARAGRASYVAKERQVSPDPGAVAVAIILRNVYAAIYEETAHRIENAAY